MKLNVVEITPETADAITIHFEHPDKLPVSYKSGQFLTLIVPINGQKVRRAYSLCSAPHENRLSVTVKRVPGGLVSNYLLDNLKTGDVMEVMEPIGNFCISCVPAATRHIVLFGAGSGITPLMSILKNVLREEANSRVTLIYGNRNEDSIIFKDQLEQMQQHYEGRLTVAHVFSQPNNPNVPHKGRLNRSLILRILEKLPPMYDTQYFMCGPDGMMEEVKEALKLLRVPQDRIHKESFVSNKLENAHAHGDVSAAGTGEITTQTVTIQYEGSDYEVTVEPNQTILEAALEQDIDLPYSCQAGLCTACRGKCLSGSVHLDEREGLSDAELAEGYVLTCVGHPLTSGVVIEIG